MGRPAWLLAGALRLLQAARRGPTDFAVRNPVLLLLLLRAAEEVYRRFLARRQYMLGRWRVQRKTDEIDEELIQVSLLTCQELVRLGRVEKRTLFMKPMREVFGSDEYLISELLKGARKCRQQSSNCLVMRWVPPDERYHILQACLNAVSSLFGGNYVHQNALGGEQTELFKSTWFCLTVMTPTASKESRRLTRGSSDVHGGSDTCTFTDMSRTPRATLRIAIANETELRAIADGKLQPPSWGFFNHRHAERYNVLRNFAENFQRQLVSTPANPRGAPSRSPFTSERAHRTDSKGSSGGGMSKPDGGPMKRAASMNNLSLLGADRAGQRGPGPLARSVRQAQGEGEQLNGGGHAAAVAVPEPAGTDLDRPAERGASEDNCFLRLHVPHFVGEKQSKVQMPGIKHSASCSSFADAALGSGSQPLGAMLAPAGLAGHAKTRSMPGGG